MRDRLLTLCCIDNQRKLIIFNHINDMRTPFSYLIGALTKQNSQPGVAVEQILLDRLELEIGDDLRIGETDFQVRAVIENEPDRLSGGFSFGPRAMIYAEYLEGTGLIRPGSLVHWR